MGIATDLYGFHAALASRPQRGWQHREQENADERGG